MGAITLQFVTTNQLLSRAIRLFQRGWISHVDGVTADGRLLGSQNVGGVQIRPPNYEKFSRFERFNIPVSDEQEELYWNFLHEQIGKPYDTLAIAAFVFNRDWRSRMGGFVTSWLRPVSNTLRWCASWLRTSTGSTCATLYLVVSAIAPVS